MKKKLSIVFIVVFVLLFATACKGTVTRTLRHEGFNVSGDIQCKMLYDGKEGEKIKYLAGDKLITEDGKIFDFSKEKAFSTGSNCRLADTDLRVVALFDNSVFKAQDGKFYLLSTNNDAIEYQEVISTDNYYKVYELLLKPDDTIKVITADSNKGVYFVLKNDGNVYVYSVTQGEGNSASITGTSVVYSKDDYGGQIVDFNYAGNSAATFVRTITNKVYFMKPTNSKECSQYADVVCNYEMEEAPFFEKYYDYVLVYNGQTVITTYHRVFTVIG